MKISHDEFSCPDHGILQPCQTAIVTVQTCAERGCSVRRRIHVGCGRTVTGRKRSSMTPETGSEETTMKGGT